MSLSEIKRAQNIYKFAIEKKDWKREVEALSSLRLLYNHEGDHVKEERRTIALWKEALERALKTFGAKQLGSLYPIYYADLKMCYKLESEYLFRSFLIYLEWERPTDKRFYQPRRKVFDPVVDALQDLEDGKLDILGISTPPRIGKSTLGLLYILWIAGRHPEQSAFGSGHSTGLMNSFYDGINEFATSDMYNYKKIFPNSQRTDTDAKKNEIDFGEPARFKTITFCSIDSNMSGRIEATSLLYVDDLIADIQEAQKPERLLNAYTKYATDIKQRRKDKVPILMIGTRWSLNDPIGVESRDNEGNPRARFIVIPALDENGESNFDFDYGVGFTTKYYVDMKRALDMIDPAIFSSVYMQNPIESEGMCFKDSDLKKYNGELEKEGFIGTSAYGDPAWGGLDSASFPIGDVYEREGARHVFIKDWVFTRQAKDISIPLIVQAIISNKVQRAKFESNNGGTEYSEEVSRQLRRMGYSCEVTTQAASTKLAKAEKIKQYAPDIKTFFHFLDEPLRTQQYRIAMMELTSWMITGKSPHDDAPDSLAGLSEMILGNRTGTFTVMDRRGFGL